MSEIRKKVYKEWFDRIVSGEKTFELRLNDWKCQPGDILILDEIDENSAPTGRSLRKKVGTVVKTNEIDYWSENEIAKYGYQIISLLEEAK
jgi:hypothetical protein